MKTKRRTIGGTEYVILGSTTESERGVVVFQSFTTYGGKVVIENGRVTHPDGRVTNHYGDPIVERKASNACTRS